VRRRRNHLQPPCPKGKKAVVFFSGPTKDNTDYILRVGHRPEKADLPQGAAQTAYVCTHGTEIGGPPLYS
jgi:hypothetical protein